MTAANESSSLEAALEQHSGVVGVSFSGQGRQQRQGIRGGKSLSGHYWDG